MKNFSELLATDIDLDVEVHTSQGVTRFCWPLLKPLDFIFQDPQSVRVDGMELIEFGWYENDVWKIKHNEIFCRWRHHVTGQGWLLDPIKI